MEMDKVEKSQNVDFWIWKVKLWPTIYSNLIWILKKWMQIHAREVETNEDGKNGNVDFWIEKVKVWLWLKWSNDYLALGLNLMGNSNILLDNPTNT